jgi:hypothetical protein
VADDWRLEHLRTLPFLRGLRFQRKPYKAYSASWDHDHCVGCWATFAERDSGSERIEREGYATTADYEKGAEYEWACIACFSLFRGEMGWIEVTN